MATALGSGIDSTLALAVEGYGWLPNLRRRTGGDTVRTRLLGAPVTALCGPDAARFFYDEANVRRHGAIPGPVLSTLFGHGAVHTLDGPAHRVRKHALVSVLAPAERIAALVDGVVARWDAAVDTWRERPAVSLFEESSRVIAGAVCGWAGVPLGEDEVPAVAGDLTAMVDGFAAVGPRHLRARRARARREAQLAELVERVRDGSVLVPEGCAVDVLAAHRDADGEQLDPWVAAVEVLNVLRPTTAVSWFVAFAAHALHRWPEYRSRLRSGDPEYAEAFAHEVRRFYPFAPFVGGRAVTDLCWRDQEIAEGSIVLLDLYGQDHDPLLWPDPYRFDPARFLDRKIGEFDLVPQGAGDRSTGHRCPGEDVTVELLEALAVRLARLEYQVPHQDLDIPLHRIPTLPKSGFVVAAVRPWAG